MCFCNDDGFRLSSAFAEDQGTQFAACAKRFPPAPDTPDATTSTKSLGTNTLPPPSGRLYSKRVDTLLPTLSSSPKGGGVPSVLIYLLSLLSSSCNLFNVARLSCCSFYFSCNDVEKENRKTKPVGPLDLLDSCMKCVNSPFEHLNLMWCSGGPFNMCVCL